MCVTVMTDDQQHPSDLKSCLTGFKQVWGALHLMSVSDLNGLALQLHYIFTYSIETFIAHDS